MSVESLKIILTQGAINNGYLSVPADQNYFPVQYLADESGNSAENFTLILPNGEMRSTCLLTKFGRIQARFNALFNQQALRPGDVAILIADDSVSGHYRLSFKIQAQSDTTQPILTSDSIFMKDDIALNTILYGPPGTGKTYATIDAALEILDGEFLIANRENRSALKLRYDELVDQRLIRFVTFHQSFSYEDFVEGLRADSDDGQLHYEVSDGIFKSICDAASARVTQQSPVSIDLNGRRIWKMSIGDSHKDDDYLFEEAVENGYVLLGWGGGIDFSGCQSREDIVDRHRKAGKEVSDDEYRVAAISTFLLKIKDGDLIVVTDGNLKFRAVAEVIGGYKFLVGHERGDQYVQSRPVKWLRVYSPSLSYDQLMKKRFMQQSLYELKPNAIDLEKFSGLLSMAGDGSGLKIEPFFVGQQFGSGYVVERVSQDLIELRKPRGGLLPLPRIIIEQLANLVSAEKVTLEQLGEANISEKIGDGDIEKYMVVGYRNIIPAMVKVALNAKSGVKTASNSRVLIIDEINRGNVSRIFGELITLIEPSKRAGAAEALQVTLPYSKNLFSVPDNVYIICTMNTADRSLAALDIALRRRFTFKEMPPRPDLLEGVMVEDVDIRELLSVMNQRIEVLLDRDHCLGHAYFMPLKDDSSLSRLAVIFRNQIIPLLQEYFFEDWQRIQWVLNDHRKTIDGDRFLTQPSVNHQHLFGDGVNPSGQGVRWTINKDSFDRIDAYRGIINTQA